MKKIILCLFLTTIIGAPAFSQKVQLGIKGGVNSSTLVYKSTEDNNLRYEGSTVGAQAGGIAHINVSESFAIQPQLLFALKGGSLQGYKINTMHAEIPLNFLYQHQGFFIGGGPNFSYGFSGKIKDVPGGDLDIYNADEAEDYTIKRFDIGANVLMGYTFPGGLSFSANYTPGLIDIYEGDGSSGNIRSTSKWFGFSVGYMFGKKK